MTLSFPRSIPRRGLSLQARITGVAMITSVIVLAAACAGFTVHEWDQEGDALATRQGILAKVIASGDTVLPAFSDPARARQVAARLHMNVPDCREIQLLDPTGRVLGEAGSASGDLVDSRAPVLQDGKVIGQVSIRSHRPTLASILPQYLALCAVLLLGAAGLSMLLGRWMARRVTRPIDRLSEAMAKVAASGDFTESVEPSGDDELGRLTSAFNDLLARLSLKCSDLKVAMAELVDARDAAEAANQSKSQFLAHMSHEIRTPLNGLLAMTQVMALEELSTVQRERLEVIRRSGEALLAILNDVLDVSKMEAGKLELEISDFDCAEVVRSVHAAFTPVADKKGLPLVLCIEDEARGIRTGDSTRLRQILSNIVANALKFTQRGEVRVTVRGEGAAGADGLKLEIADTGIGIPADVAPLLFQKFTQADSSTSRRFGGTGLGLAICLELCELMGGRIWVESVEGRGSTFHVLIPARRVAPAPAEPVRPVAAPAPPVQPERPEAPAAAAPVAANPVAASPVAASPVAAAPAEGAEAPLKVLAAEDNATNQLVLKTVMGIFGVELTIVGNGRLAVEAWAKGDYDLILMDIQMPEVDGMTATRTIRATEAEEGRTRIPIIALSAHAMTHQVREYLDAGIDLHVPKPIELAKLQAGIEQVMSEAEARRAAA